jgi:hypothetical protein
VARTRAIRWLRSTCIAAVVVTGAWLVDYDLALTAKYRGAAMAHWDWWRGHKEIKLYGLPLPSRPQFTALLEARYGVRANPVALCIVSRSLADYADAYNRVMRTRLQRRYGRDVIAEVANEAETAPTNGRK